MRALWLVPVLALALTACGGEPKAELRGDVESVTLAANDGDAEGVRDAVEDLLSTIRRQVANNELARDEGERLRAIALRIAESADLLDPEPTPSPTPVEETEEPEPTQEPSPTPEPEPTQEPSPTPEPVETAEPAPTEEPLIEITPAGDGQSSPSPAQAARPSPAGGHPSPSSAA